MPIPVLIASRLREAGPSVATAFQLRMEQYFDVVRGLVDNFANEEGIECIYVAASIPAATTKEALTTLEIETGRTWFVDCLSHMLMVDIGHDDRIIYIESPTMLENLILKVEYLQRRIGTGETLVVLDSIDSLSIHNEPKILSQFLQIFLGGLRDRGSYPVVLTMTDSRPEIKEMVGLICDQIVTLEG